MDENIKEKIEESISETDFMLECLLTSAKNNSGNQKCSCEDLVCKTIREELKKIQNLLIASL